MIRKIRAESKSDPELKRLLDNAGECAEMYLLARKTQTGCDGMGELVTMKEEFRDCMDNVIQYYKEKKYISEDISYDIDSIADEIVRGHDTL